VSDILEVRELRAYYDQVQALHGIDLSLREGSVTTLLGANGAGKTTTLRLIAGLERVTEVARRLDDETLRRAQIRAQYAALDRMGRGGPDPDEAAAEAVLSALLAAMGGGEIFLDVPSVNPEAVALAQSIGLSPVFETARMYSGAIPPLRTERVFGVTTFELG